MRNVQNLQYVKQKTRASAFKSHKSKNSVTLILEFFHMWTFKRFNVEDDPSFQSAILSVSHHLTILTE